MTRQLWLSSPVSGPSKYNYWRKYGKWYNERQLFPQQSENGAEDKESTKSTNSNNFDIPAKGLKELLEAEFSKCFNISLRFDADF